MPGPRGFSKANKNDGTLLHDGTLSLGADAIEAMAKEEHGIRTPSREESGVSFWDSGPDENRTSGR